MHGVAEKAYQKIEDILAIYQWFIGNIWEKLEIFLKVFLKQYLSFFYFLFIFLFSTTFYIYLINAILKITITSFLIFFIYPFNFISF